MNGEFQKNYHIWDCQKLKFQEFSFLPPLFFQKKHVKILNHSWLLLIGLINRVVLIKRIKEEEEKKEEDEEEQERGRRRTTTLKIERRRREPLPHIRYAVMTCEAATTPASVNSSSLLPSTGPMAGGPGCKMAISA